MHEDVEVPDEVGHEDRVYVDCDERSLSGTAPVLYVHDLPLEAGVELGVGRILITVVLYLSAGATAAAAVRRERDAWLVAPGVAAFLIANLVDWEWHLPLSGAIWAVLLGATIARGRGFRHPRAGETGARAVIPAGRG